MRHRGQGHIHTATPPTRRRHQPPAKWRRIEVATPLGCFGCCGSGFKYYTLWVLQILIWLGTRWLVAEGQAGRMMQKDIISHRRPPPRAVWMRIWSEARTWSWRGLRMCSCLGCWSAEEEEKEEEKDVKEGTEYYERVKRFKSYFSF